MRGMLTDDIQHIAKKFLQREISIKELRLYPYIDYCKAIEIIKAGGIDG